MFSARAVAGSRWWSSARSAVLSSAPKPSACVTTSPPASTAIIFRKGERFRSGSSAPKARSKMSVQAGGGAPSNYFSQMVAQVRHAAAQLVRSPSHSRRAEAARRSARLAVLLAAILSATIIALMYAVDVREIDLMPPRGSPDLWPVRILTDFGKAAYVLWPLAVALLAVALIAPRLRGASRSLWLRFGTRLQFLFFAVLVPVLAGEVIKWLVGRGRPFVGGKANAFNFEPFAGIEAYASFPSSHAITSAALAFAVPAVSPRARGGMSV